MYKVNIISLLVYMGLALLFIIWLIPAQCPPWPGYGIPASLFPNIMAWTILILSLVQLVITLVKKPGKDQSTWLTWRGFGRFCLFIGVLLAGWTGIKLIGFIASGFLTVCALQWLMGEKRPLVIIIVAAATVASLYMVLVYGLRVLMP